MCSSIDLAISTFFDPVHCDLTIGYSQTHLSPEVDLPLLKFHRVRKFFQDSSPKKEFSDNPSFHCENKFHRYDSTSTLEVVWRNWCIYRFSFHFTLSFPCCFGSIRSQYSWEEDAQFFELLKIVEDSPYWAGGRSKSFPLIPVPFCVSRGNPESQRGKVLGLRIVEVPSGTWVAPELLPDSGSKNSVASDKGFTLF